jgi:sugar (pentulose or hexulose) kinase
LLSQFAADAMNKPVYAGPAEATAIGNLLMQAKAMGRVRDLDHIRKIVRASNEIVEYVPRDAQGWEDAYTKFTELKELKVD